MGFLNKLVPIGFGNTIAADRIVAIISPASAPAKKLKTEAKKENRLVDATHGRKTRTILVMDSNHIVLSAVHIETLCQRFQPKMDGSKFLAEHSTDAEEMEAIHD
ncbi:extracellular matrix/biofilm biosynthesis regulator RemA family protein [Desulfatirhabdium butyrativorans]|uniref:extracellular matrix/biofilm biosynthesis regulator RemA family protein n=1 Tax=Desulfatirhabdium butyrativorans TaxID=340467 RepID=UPI0003FBF945